MWCASDLDDEHLAKMEDVLETYEKPYDPAEPVVCLDEKPITLHANVRPASPAQPETGSPPGQRARAEGHGQRFLRGRAKAGRHFTFATPDRSGFEFAQVARKPDMQYPDAETIHLVIGDPNIHRRKSLKDVFGIEVGAEIWDRFTVHYTLPTAVRSIRRQSK